MKDQLLASLDECKKISKKNDLTDFDIIATGSKSLQLSSTGKKIDKFSSSVSQTFGIRVILNDRVGLAYSESSQKEDLEFMIKQAVENSKISKVNKSEKINTISPTNKKFDQTSTKEVNIEDKKKLVIDLESKVLAGHPLAVAAPYNGYQDSESYHIYSNSKGVELLKKHQSYSCYTSALLKDDGKNSMHYQGTVANTFEELNPQMCISESLEHAKAWLDPKKCESGKQDIIFTVDTLESLFDCFQRIFSGKSAMENNNPFLEKLGKSIGHSDFYLSDIPNDPKFHFTSPFDSEGNLMTNIDLISAGVLKDFFHNSITSEYLKVKNNYRAARSPKSPLGVGGSHFVIQPGKSSDDNLTRAPYLEIHSLQGLHSGANDSSGNFSFAASGYWCESGQKLFPVRGVTVAGNFFQMMKTMESPGLKQTLSTNKSFYAPVIRFNDLTIGN